MSKGITVKDVNSHEFVTSYAAHLKKQGKIQLPELVDLMKTGPFKELAPYNEDWFYVRCASLARRLYIRKGTGVGAFGKVYGDKKRRGTLPGHFCKASRGVIRGCLIQLEKIGVVSKCEKGGGREISLQGRQDCDRIATEVYNSKQ
mmetsp:Transcript_24001/g.57280  ORF Transcript_24001/g.57280 Transcript_24001/m.57280 type:complete len:146 (-) Transcript_24001:99-536(-)|eukprot:CAMPEP_0177706530 /NCGR_PEP_ID=MMETSP0484_2-20121128/9275_1 /TAXON_ID=354590 /ORGANISM="Rhodomonas lens, Strain RHODO" /LENGTH=145 /DNA_ID=CAMNT_0019217999 /DNA_START=327 /DNA_END=764 /DNA_ORIENTATION=+